MMMELYRAREREVLIEAKTALLLKEARAHGPQRRDRFLASIGGILVSSGPRLKERVSAQSPTRGTASALRVDRLADVGLTVAAETRVA